MTFQNRHNVKCNIWILFVFVSEAEDKSPSLPGSRLQVENVPKFSVTNQQQNECNYSVNKDINKVIGNMFSNSIKKNSLHDVTLHYCQLSLCVVCEELRHRNKKLHTSQIKYSEDLFLRWLIPDSFQWDSQRMAEMHNSKIFTLVNIFSGWCTASLHQARPTVSTKPMAKIQATTAPTQIWYPLQTVSYHTL